MAKTLEPQDMADPRYVPHIAQKLQRLHSLPTSGRFLTQPCSLTATDCPSYFPARC